MKPNPSTKEIQEALARVEKAKSERANSQRRLSRAKEAVDKAAKEVSDSDDEFKAASTYLDQAIRRGLAAAMKKGGADTSVRLAEIIAQSLGGGDDGDTDPAPTLPLTPPSSTDAGQKAPAGSTAESTAPRSDDGSGDDAGGTGSLSDAG